MSGYAAPALFALFAWWFSTGAIIWLDGLPRVTFKWTMAGATALAGVGFWLLWASAGGTDAHDAYLAFCGVLAVWAWLESSLYLGFVTGLPIERCAHDCKGWRHFGHALKANIWHELAIVALFGVVLWISWEAPNKTGLWTFLILWWMHESARLNVFLGVRNLNEHFLPEHLEFLKGFMRKADMNLLFPVSVTVSTVVCALTAFAAFGAETDFERTSMMFLTTIMALAIIEHWFLILPLPFEALWNWSLGSRDRPAKPPAGARRITPAAKIKQPRPAA